MSASLLGCKELKMQKTMNFKADVQIHKTKTQNKKSQYLSIKSGESVSGLFMGSPCDYKVHWDNKVPTICVGADFCRFCKNNDLPKFRFKINFVTKQPEGELCAYVWEQGSKTYQKLKEMNATHPLPQWIVKITRIGEGTDTEYSIEPTKQINPSMEASLSKVSLHNFEEDIQLEMNKALGQSDENPSYPPDDIVF